MPREDVNPAGIDFDEASAAWRANKQRRVGAEGCFEYIQGSEAYAQWVCPRLFYRVNVIFNKGTAVEIRWAYPFQREELVAGSVIKLVSSAARKRGLLKATDKTDSYGDPTEFVCNRPKALKRFQLRMHNRKV